MRNIALAILMEVTENEAYANIALRKGLAQTTLEPRDRALVTEIVNETLRNLRVIDGIINHFSTLPVDQMKPYIRNLLRISICQLRVLTKIPPHAAVHEAVELAKSQGYGKLAGFVNGILRNAVRNPDTPPPPSEDSWALRYSYPAKLANDIKRWLGKEDAKTFAQNSHIPPALTIFTNTTKTTPEALAATLAAVDIECEPLENGLFALRNTGDISALPAFKEGLFFVIDAGAVAAVRALQLQPHQTLLDLCAAPGGKTFAAAAFMQNTGEITALDLHPHRVTLIEMTAKRLGFTQIKTLVGDGTSISLPQYDAVLLDAPCSGLGTIRKRPEIKYKYNGTDETLPDVQRNLFANAAKHVKPNGTLVYSTCTVARDENHDMVEWFLKYHLQFYLDSQEQLLPGSHNDGFFIARLVRG
ncbi:MAG: 16S rRNA (cytosine(967)-C(5))-methyltransferase RsmB [Defluviitaleaceae bacterium]|nr:16S rRNA (cytosine(967)-C(5))-methyltransferase RsmB [Defluviitaleaceae bacterium]MCL2274202.1 16S rRNA (cytosine(967)-C(5))-methyltransferase RsmB [Defluviitaleaceae bacterium]